MTQTSKTQKQLDMDAQAAWMRAHGITRVAVDANESDSQMEQRRERQMFNYQETRFDNEQE
jgi:hypothetical protein